jgi:hypothetical protein
VVTALGAPVGGAIDAAAAGGVTEETRAAGRQ